MAQKKQSAKEASTQGAKASAAGSAPLQDVQAAHNRFFETLLGSRNEAATRLGLAWAELGRSVQDQRVESCRRIEDAYLNGLRKAQAAAEAGSEAKASLADLQRDVADESQQVDADFQQSAQEAFQTYGQSFQDLDGRLRSVCESAYQDYLKAARKVFSECKPEDVQTINLLGQSLAAVSVFVCGLYQARGVPE